jgi:hypothetical protein
MCQGAVFCGIYDNQKTWVGEGVDCSGLVHKTWAMKDAQVEFGPLKFHRRYLDEKRSFLIFIVCNGFISLPEIQY